MPRQEMEVSVVIEMLGCIASISGFVLAWWLEKKTDEILNKK